MTQIKEQLSWERLLIDDAVAALRAGRSVVIHAGGVNSTCQLFAQAEPGRRVIVGVVGGKAGPQAVAEADFYRACWMAAEVKSEQ